MRASVNDFSIAAKSKEEFDKVIAEQVVREQTKPLCEC